MTITELLARAKELEAERDAQCCCIDRNVAPTSPNFYKDCDSCERINVALDAVNKLCEGVK